MKFEIEILNFKVGDFNLFTTALYLNIPYKVRVVIHLTIYQYVDFKSYQGCDLFKRSPL